jgi:hypothetical protein
MPIVHGNEPQVSYYFGVFGPLSSSMIRHRMPEFLGMESRLGRVLDLMS